MVKQFFADLKTNQSRNHERFIGLALFLAHFTGYCATKGRSAFVHRVSSSATEKNTKVKVF